MRKGQIKLLEIANTWGFTEEKIGVLKREDLTLKELNRCYHLLFPFRKIYIENIGLYLKKMETIEKWLDSDCYMQDLAEKNALCAAYYGRVFWGETNEWQLSFVLSDRNIYEKILIISLSKGIVDEKPCNEFIQILSDIREYPISSAFRFKKFAELCNSPLQKSFFSLLKQCNTDEKFQSLIYFCNEYDFILDLPTEDFDRLASKCINAHIYEFGNIMAYYNAEKKFPELLKLNNDLCVKKGLLEDEQIKKYKKITEAGKELDLHEIIISSPCFSCKSNIGNSSIEINLHKSDKTKLDIGTDARIYLEGARTKVDIVIFFDGKIYEKKNGGNKLIPLSIRHAYYYQKDFGWYMQQILEAFYKHHFESGAAQTAINELMNLEIPSTRFLPNVDLNEFIGHKSLNSLMKTRYKNSQIINWNRVGLQNGYCTLKTLPLLDSKSRSWLLNELHNKRIPQLEMYPHSAADIGIIVCATILMQAQDDDYLYNEYGYAREETMAIMKDYISMSKKHRKKINIKKTSFKKLREEHDFLEAEETAVKIPKITIPKHSTFNKLRKMLPQNFEWITSKKRLAKEGAEMKHCVTSYAGGINSDYCAIYSLYYEPEDKRYTIEFVKGKEKEEYRIVQIQSACNMGASDEVRKYVGSFLKHSTEKE